MVKKLNAQFIILYLAAFLVWKQLVFGPYSFVLLRWLFLIASLFFVGPYLSTSKENLARPYSNSRLLELTLFWIAVTLCVRWLLTGLYNFPLISLNAMISEIVVAPINEEIFFRGLIFGILMQDYPKQPLFNLVICTLIFTCVHSGLNANYILGLTLQGLIYTTCYWRTRSLFPVIFCHMLWNLLGFRYS